MSDLKQAAEECRKDWVEKTRHLAPERVYKDNKDTLGIHVVPFAFEAGVMWERRRLGEKLAIAREFIYEVSLPKFKDLDPDSLLETLRRNAIKFIEATNNLT